MLFTRHKLVFEYLTLTMTSALRKNKKAIFVHSFWTLGFSVSESVNGFSSSAFFEA
jgi:hypothetical protein